MNPELQVVLPRAFSTIEIGGQWVEVSEVEDAFGVSRTCKALVLVLVKMSDGRLEPWVEEAPHRPKHDGLVVYHRWSDVRSWAPAGEDGPG